MPGLQHDDITLPRNKIEADIAQIWQEVLQREDIDVTSSFFEIGGTSLLLLQVLALIRERLQIEIAAVDLFKHPTIDALASYLSQQQAQRSAPATSPFHAVREQARKQQEAIRRQQERTRQRRDPRGSIGNPPTR